MDVGQQMRSAVDALTRLGIEVRQEHLEGGGGLCDVRGRRMLFVDLDADAATRLTQCIHALAAIPEADRCFLPPNLREAVDELGLPSVPAAERGASDPGQASGEGAHKNDAPPNP